VGQGKSGRGVCSRKVKTTRKGVGRGVKRSSKRKGYKEKIWVCHTQQKLRLPNQKHRGGRVTESTLIGDDASEVEKKKNVPVRLRRTIGGKVGRKKHLHPINTSATAKTVPDEERVSGGLIQERGRKSNGKRSVGKGAGGLPIAKRGGGIKGKSTRCVRKTRVQGNIRVASGLGQHKKHNKEGDCVDSSDSTKKQ